MLGERPKDVTLAKAPKRAGVIAAGVGLAAFLCVVATLWAPGLTVDEPLDVQPGREYVRLLGRTGWSFFTPEVIDRTYFDNKEHPPLGRWLLGLSSRVVEPIEVLLRGRDPVGIYVRSGRLAPAAAFGVLVGLIAWEVRRWGVAAMAGAGLGLLLMPRVFAHAHLGALDTFVALFWTWALLAARRAVETRRPVRAMAAAGLIWGLALLTKIHAWLLIPLVASWVMTRLPWRCALAALSVWLLVGWGLFFAAWPWLWIDPAGRLAAYLRTGTDRTPIFVQYFGQVLRDVDVPWHYPWVYFAVTVPLGLQVLGVVGALAAAFAKPRSRAWLLPALAVVMWLALFSTSVPVYDGERLFLPVFPLWALAIGRGAAEAWTRAGRSNWGRGALVVLFASQAYGLVTTFPFGLSYYSALVGGLPGAERHGLELTYWGDAVDDELIAAVDRAASEGQGVCLVPTLAPDQGKMATSLALATRGIVIGDQQALEASEWVLISRRSAYWPPGLVRWLESPPAAVRARQGVWLSGLWRRPERKIVGAN